MGISWGLHDRVYGPPPEGAQCFYCYGGVPRDRPAIEWLGAAGAIWLHPDCALKLIVRLTRDVHEVECKST